MCVILLTRKEIIFTIWPNRDDTNHGLIIMIDVDSQKMNDQDDLFLSSFKKARSVQSEIIDRWTRPFI
jgi:hypothetical protein